MKPSLSLGPWDAPEFEILHSDLYPFLALMIEHYHPLNEADADSVISLLQVNGSYLKKETEGFFLKFEAICQRIQSGELTRYDTTILHRPELAFYLRRMTNDGVITPEVKAAAQGFLDFLATNPDHWPLR